MKSISTQLNNRTEENLEKVVQEVAVKPIEEVIIEEWVKQVDVQNKLKELARKASGETNWTAFTNRSLKTDKT